jgi:uncharacterized oligopeptide transporter (OPT) family protein
VELYLHSPNTFSWHGAQFKKQHRNHFYLYLLPFRGSLDLRNVGNVPQHNPDDLDLNIAALKASNLASSTVTLYMTHKCAVHDVAAGLWYLLIVFKLLFWVAGFMMTARCAATWTVVGSALTSSRGTPWIFQTTQTSSSVTCSWSVDYCCTDLK